MSHSGYDPRLEAEAKEAFKKIIGEYPDGRLNANDEGAVSVVIAHQGGKVVMQFPKSLNWIGFTPEQAIEIAETLVQHARACGCQRPLTLKIG